MGLFDLFGSKKKKIQDFQRRGAVILDVRTKGEFINGAINGSKNISLQELEAKIAEIKKWNRPIIACCQSGIRSGTAASILNRNGIEAMNGGGWASLNNKLE